jgi:hypothetical protein
MAPSGDRGETDSGGKARKPLHKRPLLWVIIVLLAVAFFVVFTVYPDWAEAQAASLIMTGALAVAGGRYG